MDIKSVINSLHSPSYNPPRSGKDLSHRKIFSMKLGELLPVLCEECVPEDYFEIDLASLVRTCMPMQTAAYLRAKIHFDFFFVPMTSIWRNFDAFYYQRADNYTSYKQGMNYEPNINLLNLVVAQQMGNTNATAGIRDSKAGRAKLCELLGYSDWSGFTAADFASGAQFGNLADKSLSALPLFAYNRIYNLHYRNGWLDEPTADDVRSMSADCLDCSTYLDSLVYPTTSLTDNPEIPGIVQLHYHQYPQDLFQGLLPSQQFGVVSSVSVNALSNSLILKRSDGGNISSSDPKLYTGSSISNLFDGSPSNNSELKFYNNIESSFDIIALRKALALQKWKEYNSRAGWKAGAQQRAMFGVGEASDRVHDVEFIDSYQFPIMVDEVVQSGAGVLSNGTTSQSTKWYETKLGDIAGKGIGIGNGHKIKFNVGKRWGYLMCIAYISADTEYNALGIDKQLVRSTPDQHYMPAFANLGLEPVFKFELNAHGDQTKFNNTLGFSTRYHEYKTRVDKVFGLFKSGKSFSNWCAPRRDLANIANSGTIPTSYLYVNPNCLDTIFYANSDGTLNTDQFMCNVNFEVKAVRSMSDLGLPQL